ncbi:MAG: hypothetical protein AAB864_00195 [Patescibacteria group bacterium]
MAPQGRKKNPALQPDVTKGIVPAQPSAPTKGRGPFYSLNPDFEFFAELRALVLKSASDERDQMIRNIARLGRVKLAIAAGILINTRDVRNESVLTDLFIVGDDISRRRIGVFLKNLEADIGKEVKLGVMDLDEFEYRYTMFDRFIRVLLEGPHEKLINKLGV